jgi:signal transduction histidine kinase
MTRQALLVVDDSQAERQLMAITLGEAFPDAEILTAASPSVSKAMCEAHQFDCILMDYNMPEMDGLALAHQLKAADPYLATVLMTSVGDETLAAEALRSGLSDYIPKGRITVNSIQRSVGRAILTCSQARLIDEQREELENFAYALAHDFKQPIRQITTFSMLVAEQLRSVEVGDVQLHLKFLSEAALRLGKLVDVMSQYTLLNQPPELANVDVGRVADSVRSSLAPYLAERRGVFATPEHSPMIRGNETLMTQVLQNLVINGLRYNRSRSPRVKLTARREGEEWVLDIADNGVGIEAAYLSEIFKPLFRLHSASEYPGAGLGLTLARKAVVAQQGAIWCESVVGAGSVFHVRLPAVASGETPPTDYAAEPSGPTAGEGGRASKPLN